MFNWKARPVYGAITVKLIFCLNDVPLDRYLYEIVHKLNTLKHVYHILKLSLLATKRTAIISSLVKVYLRPDIKSL